MKNFKISLFVAVLILISMLLMVFPIVWIFQLLGVTYTSWKTLALFTLFYIFWNEVVELILRKIFPDLPKILLHFFSYVISLLIADIIVTSVAFPLISIFVIAIFFTGFEYLIDKYTEKNPD